MPEFEVSRSSNVSTPEEIFHKVHSIQFHSQDKQLHNTVSSVLCTEFAAEVAELNQLLEAMNRSKLVQNSKYIN